MEKKEILVIGDVILDEYVTGNFERISPEAPVPILDVSCEEFRLGGAANVAANVAALGCSVNLFGITGEDAAKEVVVALCADNNITVDLVSPASEQTIVKSRMMAGGHQLLRVDREKKFGAKSSKDLLAKTLDSIEKYSMIVISDYAKGSLLHTQQVIAKCNLLKIPVLVDTKSRNLEEYRNSFLIKPNLKEFQALVGKVETQDELVSKGSKLCSAFGVEHLVVTMGPKGVAYVRADDFWRMMPATARQVYDVSGAGDTFLAALAVSLNSGMTVLDSVFRANFAAGIVVGKVGTTVIDLEELTTALRTPISS